MNICADRYKPLNCFQTEEESKCYDYRSMAKCMTVAMMQSMMEESRDMTGDLVSGMVEYLVTGDIADTWTQIRHTPHVNTAATCAHRFTTC